MTSKNYWKDRLVREREALLNRTIAECEKELKKYYRKASYKIRKELEKLRIELESGKDVLNSHVYKYNKYYEALARVERELNSLSHKEISLLDKKLTKLYNSNVDLLGRHLGFSIQPDPAMVKHVVNAYWVADGKNWSDRIWTNKGLLIRKLEEEMTDMVNIGKSHDTVTKEVMKTCSQGFSNASRLVRTELCHVQTQSALDSYKAAGLTKYRFLATKDTRTCGETCALLDGKTFNIEEAEYGVNLPPTHPNCRCTVLGVIESRRIEK